MVSPCLVYVFIYIYLVAGNSLGLGEFVIFSYVRVRNGNGTLVREVFWPKDAQEILKIKLPKREEDHPGTSLFEVRTSWHSNLKQSDENQTGSSIARKGDRNMWNLCVEC